MNDATHLCRLLITPGEPSGIGPDITLKIAEKNIDATIIAIADPDLLDQRAKQLGINIDLNVINDVDTTTYRHQPGHLNVIPVPAAPTQAGTLNTENSSYTLECLKLAANYCLDEKRTAMVTGPVHKGIINDAGFSFTGHTEFLADISHSKPVMMLATPSLRVALATTHLPLNKVSEAITNESLEYTINTLNEFLKKHCGITRPSLLVCGLNPHAGEDGHLGMEEIEVISPTIEACRSNGVDIIGPIPADTAFTKKYLEQADAVLAMYHDQGLPVLKYSGFGEAVNITLGLPFIRTSVDHGTALDLAGTGKADENSMLTAIDMAITLSENKRLTTND